MPLPLDEAEGLILLRRLGDTASLSPAPLPLC
jgi:hypothetical protein